MRRWWRSLGRPERITSKVRRSSSVRQKKSKKPLWQHKALIFVASFAIIGTVWVSHAFAAVSPTLLYYSIENDTMSLKLREPDGNIKTLATGVFGSIGASLGPNGDFAVFVRGDDKLYKIDTATGDTQQINTGLSGIHGMPRISPDGTRVTFQYRADSQDPDLTSLYVVGINGSGLRQLTSPGNPRDVSGADWSLDGVRLVFSGFDTTTSSGNIWTMGADGTGRSRITTTDNFVTPRWTPDNKYLVFEDQSQIWASDQFGNRAKMTTFTNPNGIHNPSITNDWQLYFSQSVNGIDQIHTTQLGNTASSTAVIDNAGSPDVLRTGTVTAAPAAFLNAFTNACPSALFIGVRGSGQTESDNNGFGSTIITAANAFASQFPTAQLDHINYQAIAVGYGGADYNYTYVASEQDGEVKLTSKIIGFNSKCPKTPIALAGYSQGAHAAGNVFQQLKPKYANQIAALLMFGDTRFNGKQKGGVNQGTYDSTLNGVFTSAPVVRDKPRSFTGTNPGNRVRSYCNFGDPVCNFNPAGVTNCIVFPMNCPHIHYVDSGQADAGGLWLAQRVKNWTVK
jgi:hypothetical protein